jgi:hypothetical protein
MYDRRFTRSSEVSSLQNKKITMVIKVRGNDFDLITIIKPPNIVDKKKK